MLFLSSGGVYEDPKVVEFDSDVLLEHAMAQMAAIMAIIFFMDAKFRQGVYNHIFGGL